MNRRKSRYINNVSYCDVTSNTPSECSLFSDLASLASLYKHTLIRICGIKNVNKLKSRSKCKYRSEARTESESKNTSKCKKKRDKCKKKRGKRYCNKRNYMDNVSEYRTKKCKYDTYCQACGIGIKKDKLTCDSCSTYDCDSIHNEVKAVFKEIEAIGYSNKTGYINKCKNNKKGKKHTKRKCSKKKECKKVKKSKACKKISKHGEHGEHGERKHRENRKHKKRKAIVKRSGWIDKLRYIEMVIENRTYRILGIRVLLFYLVLKVLGIA